MARTGQPAGLPRKSAVGRTRVVSRYPQMGKARFEAVMQAAEQSGLLGGKGGWICGRVSPALIKQAKRQTGIETDTELIEFALATVALEDNFAETFKEARRKVAPLFEARLLKWQRSRRIYRVMHRHVR